MRLLVALLFVLVAGAVQAQTVVFEDGNATAILDLEVDGIVYDVAFQKDTAEAIYGPSPGEYDFSDPVDAQVAMDAVNDALDSEPEVVSVGPGFDIVYEIPFDFENNVVLVREGFYLDRENPDLGTPGWLQRGDPQGRPFLAPKTYAVFLPEPAAALRFGAVLLGLALAARGRRRA